MRLQMNRWGKRPAIGLVVLLCRRTPGFVALERSRLPPLNQDIFEEQKLNPGSEKRLERLARRVDDRLSLDVEARVQNHLATGQFPHLLEKCMKVAVVLFRDGLDTSRTVDVCDRGKGTRDVLPARRRS